MKPKIEDKIYHKGELDKKRHLSLDKNESVLGNFLIKVKSPLNSWIGNSFTSKHKLTDFVIITNKRIIYTYLIKWYGITEMRNDTVFNVVKIPLERIIEVSIIEKPKNQSEVKIVCRNNDDDEQEYIFELFEESNNAVSLINHQIELK